LGVGLGYGFASPYGYGYGYPYYGDYYADDGGYGGCYVVRQRVHTRYGWRIRPVEVLRLIGGGFCRLSDFAVIDQPRDQSNAIGLQGGRDLAAFFRSIAFVVTGCASTADSCSAATELQPMLSSDVSHTSGMRRT